MPLGYKKKKKSNPNEALGLLIYTTSLTLGSLGSQVEINLYLTITGLATNDFRGLAACNSKLMRFDGGMFK